MLLTAAVAPNHHLAAGIDGGKNKEKVMRFSEN